MRLITTTGPDTLDVDELLEPTDLRRLLSVAHELAGARTLEDVSRTVGSAARMLTGADGASFVFRRGEQAHYLDESAIAPLWKGRRFPLAKCISGLAMREERTVVVPDIQLDERIPQDLYRPTFVRSLMVTPIQRREPLGAIGVYWASVRSPHPREIALLESLAEIAATAVERALLYGELQSALRAATAANRRREQSFEWLSHDLRNPLKAIQLCTQLLEPAIARLSSEPRRHLESIRESARRMQQLIRDHLDAADLDSSRLKLKKERSSVGELLCTVSELQPLVTARGCELVIENAADDTPLQCDPDRVAQVLANLVSNALQHARGARRIEVRAVRIDHSVHFEVEDDGETLEESELTTALSHGRRRRSATQRAGLGLIIARGLVRAHGGELSARQAPERGSIFSFSIPIR